jgi:hypothetical protein
MKLFGYKFKNYFDKLDPFSTLVKIVINAETDRSSFNLVIQFQGPGSGGLGRSRRHLATRSPATQNRRGQTTPSPATRNRRGRSPEQPPEPGAATAETSRGKIEAFFYLPFRFRCGREC